MRHSLRIMCVVFCLVAILAAGCGGGGGGSDAKKAASPLVLVDVSVAGFDGVSLNEIIKFEFSEILDPDTVRPDTINIREGPNYGKQVPGFFRVDGNEVLFFPRLPTLPDLSDSGMQPGKDYRVTLPGVPKVATVRSFANDRLRKDKVETFATAIAGSKNLFIDNFLDPIPPKVLFVNPADGAIGVPAASEITVTFNRRPLHPATITESNIRLTMIERNGVALSRPIQGTPVLTQNHDSVTLVFRSRFPLADVATYALHIDRRVQDLTGNDIVEFDSVFTIRDEPLREDALVINFTEAEKAAIMDETNTTASWDELVDDALSALFTVAGGNGTAGDLRPSASVNLTPDDFPRGVQVLIEDGVEYDVYNFREINIPVGVTVRFSQRPGGPNRPVKLLSLKTICIEGTLTVSGGVGGNSESASRTSAIPLAKAGAAGPGGGDGATNYSGSKASGNGTTPAAPEMPGKDVPLGGTGGHGGLSGSHVSYCYTPGGGAGGGAREDGKNGTKGNYTSNGWNGLGGKGGLSDVSRGFPLNLLRKPNVGGAGGGSGGLAYYAPNSTNWRTGGAAGGGGGGAVTLQGASKVKIGAAGRILAIGGNGGDGAVNGWQPTGGAAGAGAGGSVLIRSTFDTELVAGAKIDVSGGTGGIWRNTYTRYKGGLGGDGGHGWIAIQAQEDENSPGKPVISGMTTADLSYGPIATGTFQPQGGGAPSTGQTNWENLGVFDPIMVKPTVSDIISTLYNDTMIIEVQMATEDPANLGNPNLTAEDLTDADGDLEFDDTLDTSTLSEWTLIQNIETLNGFSYQFIRVRITFQLDALQLVTDALPFLDLLRIVFRF
ncbi:MAG: Ig-like domain-containing protein [Planctomycetota bacterium]|nr:Ig-like domain-containing protein [Planctomycetota bacterium]